jgi:YopJ family protease
MGGCISRLNVRREISRNDGRAEEVEFAAHVDSVRSSPPRSNIEREHSAGPSHDADSGIAPHRIRPARVNEKLQLLGQTLERASQAGISSGLMEYGRQVARYLSAIS